MFKFIVNQTCASKTKYIIIDTCRYFYIITSLHIYIYIHIQLFNFLRAIYSIVFLASLLGSFLITSQKTSTRSRSGCSGLDLTRPREHCRLRQMHPWNLWVSVGLPIRSQLEANCSQPLQYLQWMGGTSTYVHLCSRRHPLYSSALVWESSITKATIRSLGRLMQEVTHVWIGMPTHEHVKIVPGRRTLSRLPSSKFISAWSSQPFFANRLKTSKLPAQATES